MPERGDVDAFASIVNATVPLPLPLTPAVMVNHESLLVAVQSQLAAVVTPTLFEPPAAAGFSDVGETPNVQGGGAPA